MVTMLEEYNTKEERSVVHFLWAKGLFTVGSVFRIKWFTTESRNLGKVSLMTKRLKRKCGSG
jgi:hypothetical protein